MEIKSIKRPWLNTSMRKQGKNDSYYQSTTWKSTRKAFMASEPHINLLPLFNIPYQNKYCADCWELGKLNDQRIELDHIVAIDDGGSKDDFTNLRSRCHAHHNKKTHNERKKRLNGKQL